VKAWRKANPGVLWLMGIVLVFLGTIHHPQPDRAVLGVVAMGTCGTNAQTAGRSADPLIPCCPRAKVTHEASPDRNRSPAACRRRLHPECSTVFADRRREWRLLFAQRGLAISLERIKNN